MMFFVSCPQRWKTTWTIWLTEFKMRTMKILNWVSHLQNDSKMSLLHHCWTEMISSNLSSVVFQVLAQQDEIARLKKQEERQNKAELEKIKGGKQHVQVKFILNTFVILRRQNIHSVFLKELENELENVRNMIQEKTLLLGSSDVRIANLCKCYAPIWSKKRAKIRISKLCQETKSSSLCLCFYFCFFQRLRLWTFTRNSNHWKMRFHTSKKQMLRTLKVKEQNVTVLL